MFKEACRRYVQMSANLMFKEGFAWDWIAAGLVILANFLLPAYTIPPAKRVYAPSDEALSYPFLVRFTESLTFALCMSCFKGIITHFRPQEDTVSDTAVALLIFLPPAAIFLTACLLFRVPLIDG